MRCLPACLSVCLSRPSFVRGVSRTSYDPNSCCTVAAAAAAAAHDDNDDDDDDALGRPRRRRALVICEMRHAKVRTVICETGCEKRCDWSECRNKTHNNLRLGIGIRLGLGSVYLFLHSDQSQHSQRFSQPVSQITVRTLAFRISQITHARRRLAEHTLLLLMHLFREAPI